MYPQWKTGKSWTGNLQKETKKADKHEEMNRLIGS